MTDFSHTLHTATQKWDFNTRREKWQSVPDSRTPQLQLHSEDLRKQSTSFDAWPSFSLFSGENSVHDKWNKFHFLHSTSKTFLVCDWLTLQPIHTQSQLADNLKIVIFSKYTCKRRGSTKTIICCKIYSCQMIISFYQFVNVRGTSPLSPMPSDWKPIKYFR